ncbi:MAG: DUF5312 domain-containing protein [Treponemataceae bacterium]|nr:DUF5312 domain-containing protein [Treponemataceae bacterium]
MAESETFRKLAAELSLEERRELLARLTSYAVLSKEVLFHEEDVPPTVDSSQQYRQAPWYYKLFLFFLSLISGKKPAELFEDRLIAKLGASVEARAPGIFDYRQSLLLPGFREELESLKEGARFFYEALDVGLNRDKGAFFAFLASLEMDFVHRRLTVETDPETIFQANSSYSTGDVRQSAQRTMEEIFQTIQEDERRRMYRDARSLHCLKELSSFLYDRFLSAFTYDGAYKSPVAPAYVVLDQMKALNDILYSLQEPPTMPLLETLFVFQFQERSKEESSDLSTEIRTLLNRAEEALGRIRQFNKRIPLTAIIRCVSRDLGYLPRVITGGEDWFVVYRDYWKHQLEEKFGLFVQNRRRADLMENFKEFFKGMLVKPLLYVSSDTNPEGIPLKNTFALSFLQAFSQYIFLPTLNRVLKPILIDGEFYKKENRAEFTEAYNELLKLGDTIASFEQKLSPSGDVGKRYDLAKSEIASLPFKRKKIQSIVQEASDEVVSIVGRASKAFRSMVAVLGGILHGEAQGKYDSLANLNTLGGRSGSYLNQLKDAYYRFEKALQILTEIQEIEAGR